MGKNDGGGGSHKWRNPGLNYGTKNMLMDGRNITVFGFVDDKWGSHIWNLSRKGRRLIQEKFFWDVRNKEHTSFWEDASQQLPCLNATTDTPLIYHNCRGSLVNQRKGFIGIRGRLDGFLKMVSMRSLGIVRKWR